MASDVSITIGVDNKQAVSGLKQVGDESEKTGSRAAGALGKMGGALGDVAKIASGFVIGAGLMKLPGFLIGAAQAAADDEAATARLHQTFRNYADMVGASSNTFEALNSLLTERIGIGQKLAFSDDEVRDSFNALLVATDDSTEATKRQAAAFDLARGANIPLGTATKLLGKITEENVDVFKRMGINLKENATEADALAAVQARFGGQADAYAKSTAGQFQQAKIAMSEIVESIGGAVLPVFTKLADFASGNLPKVQEVIGGIAEKAAALAEAGWDKIVGPLSELAGLAWDKIQAAAETVVTLASAGKDLAAVAWANAVGPLSTLAGLVWENLQNAATYIKNVADAAAPALPKMQDLSVEFFTLGGNTDKVKQALDQLLTVLRPFAERDLRSAKDAAHDLNEELKPLIEELKKWEPVLRPAAIALGVLTVAGVTPLVLALAGLTIALSGVIDIIKNQAIANIEALKYTLSTIRIVTEDVVKAFNAMAGPIGSAMTNVYTTIAPYIDMIKGLFTSMPSALYDAGRAAVEGFLGGFRAAWDAGVGAIKSMINPKNWDIPGGSPLMHAMDEFGNEAGTTFVEAYWDAITETWVPKAAAAAELLRTTFVDLAEVAGNGWYQGMVNGKSMWINPTGIPSGSEDVYDVGPWNAGKNILGDAILGGDGKWYTPGDPNYVPLMPEGPPGEAKPKIGDKTGNGTAQLTWNGSYWAQNSGLADDGTQPWQNNYGLGGGPGGGSGIVVNIGTMNGTSADVNQLAGDLKYSLYAVGIAV